MFHLLRCDVGIPFFAPKLCVCVCAELFANSMFQSHTTTKSWAGVNLGYVYRRDDAEEPEGDKRLPEGASGGAGPGLRLQTGA